MTYRTGRTVPNTLYEDDVFIGSAITGHKAAQLVRLANAGLAAGAAAESLAKPQRCICGHTTEQHMPAGWRECAYRDACGCQHYEPREATAEPGGSE